MSDHSVGLIISDTERSAISTSTKVWASTFNAKVLYALEFVTLSALLDKVSLSGSTWILFSWRGGLSEILKDKFLTKKLNEIVRTSTVYFSVPDHVDLSGKLDLLKNPIYRYADGFTVTSKRLKFAYAESVGFDKVPLFLPDFPNIELLSEISHFRLKKDQHSVIWIGNSKWGKRLGFKDHKGYRSIVQKLIEASENMNLGLSFNIINRAKKYVPNHVAMEELAKSTFLIQGSKSEGTGLPLIEALALGTFPITTDVGINRELFGDKWQNHYASTPEEFVACIQRNLGKIDPECLRRTYLAYVSAITTQLTRIRFISKAGPGEIDQFRAKYAAELGIDINGRIRWTLRYIYLGIIQLFKR
jgi:glycosyltransferase involved in cell wall biosynthesis